MQNLKPNELKRLLEDDQQDRTNQDTYQTLIDLVIEKNDDVRRQYMKDIGLYEDEAILKRNADLTTLLARPMSGIKRYQIGRNILVLFQKL